MAPGPTHSLPTTRPFIPSGTLAQPCAPPPTSPVPAQPHRCGDRLPPLGGPRRGRRRLWCSDACRRAAHTERAAAERAGVAVRVVEVPRASPAVRVPVLVPRELTPDELIAQILADPNTLRRLVWSLTGQARTKKLERQVRQDCYELARVLLPHASKY
jgi:hypothetical protein